MADTSDPDRVVGHSDMISLPDLTAETMRGNLLLRFESKLIYTYTGSILVSVNPYTDLPIYDMGNVRRYIGQRLGSLPPHVFAIADVSFCNTLEFGKDQSVIISGESGAGKTEATKLILQYLSARTAQRSVVESKMLQTSPIMEAFGNAKTVRNNNSSRFGKYMEIHFSAERNIVGARIVQYLLEKSRIVFQAKNERNYHIFYLLLAGSTDQEKQGMNLAAPETFHYLNQSGSTTVEHPSGELVDEGEQFEEVREAFSTLGIEEMEQRAIFCAVAAVLHIGNITFEKKGAEGSMVKNKQAVQIAARLLGLPPGPLDAGLVTRLNFIRKQKFVVPLTVEQAEDNRDAFAKKVYGTLFQWLIERLNTALVGPKPDRFIGVLDIFGFEHFVKNSFEQFCINYTNEKLQQHFNQHIFKLEQEIYKEEGIDWASIEFVDNQEMLDLVEKKPLGLISLLDEECRFPQASDDSLLQKFHQNHEEHPRYSKPRTSKTTFMLAHYAGDVEYEIFGWLEKNKDTVQDQIIQLLCDSKKPFVAEKVFAKTKQERAEAAEAEKEAQGARRGGGKGSNTVGSKFKEQLQELLKTLTSTMPHYVRCVKPNKTKTPMTWEDELVADQLRYAGMMETVRIRKLGYPVRFEFGEFAARFRPICDAKLVPAGNDKLALTKAIITTMKLTAKDEYQMGKTRVFLKDESRIKLEEERNLAFGKKATIIQAFWRGYVQRRDFLKLRAAVTRVSACWRSIVQRRKYLATVRKVKVLQAFARMVPVRARFRQSVAAAKTMQLAVRIAVLRRATETRWAAELERRRKIEEERRRREEEERLRREEEERKRIEAEEAARKAEEEARAAVEAAAAAADAEEKARLEAEAEAKQQAAKEAAEAETAAIAAEQEGLAKADAEQAAFQAAVDATLAPPPPPSFDGDDNFPPPPDMAAFGLEGLDFNSTDAMLPPPPPDLMAEAAEEMDNIKQAAREAELNELDVGDSLTSIMQAANAEDGEEDTDGLAALAGFGGDLEGGDDELAALLADAGDLGDDVDALAMMADGAFFDSVADEQAANPLDALAAQFGTDSPAPSPAPSPLPGRAPTEGKSEALSASDIMDLPAPEMMPPPLPDGESFGEETLDISHFPPPPDLAALPPPPSLKKDDKKRRPRSGSRRTLRRGSSRRTMRGKNSNQSCDVKVDPEPTAEELQTLNVYMCTAEEAELFQFSNFAEKHFAARSGDYGRKPHTFQEKALNGPLISDLKAVKIIRAAVDIWSKLNQFMHDKEMKEGQNDIKCSLDVMRRGVAKKFEGAPEDQRQMLRDEIYCQMMMQLSRHPQSGHALRGWCLMASCCAVFPPTSNLSKFLSAFLHGAAGRTPDVSDALMTGNQPGEEEFCTKVKQWAVFSLSLLRRSILRGERDFPLAKSEVKKVAALKMSRVQVSSGSAKLEVDIFPQTTAQELSAAVAEAMLGDAETDVTDSSVGTGFFMVHEVFHVSGKVVRRPLTPSFRIGDSIASAEEMANLDRRATPVTVTFTVSPLVIPLHATTDAPENALASFDYWKSVRSDARVSLLRAWGESVCSEFQNGMLTAFGVKTATGMLDLSVSLDDEVACDSIAHLAALSLRFLPQGADDPPLSKLLPVALVSAAASHAVRDHTWWASKIESIRSETETDLDPQSAGEQVLQLASFLFPTTFGVQSLRGLSLAGVSDAANALVGQQAAVLTLRAIASTSPMKSVQVGVNLGGLHIVPDQTDPLTAGHVATLPLWRIRTCTANGDEVTCNLVGGGVVELKFAHAGNSVGPPKATDAALGVANAVAAHLRFLAKRATCAVSLRKCDGHERGDVVPFESSTTHGDHLALMLTRISADELSGSMPEEVSKHEAALKLDSAERLSEAVRDAGSATKESVAPAAAWTFPMEALVGYAKEHGNPQCLEDEDSIAMAAPTGRSRVATLRSTVRRKRTPSLGSMGIAEMTAQAGTGGNGEAWEKLFLRRYGPLNFSLTQKVFAGGDNKIALTMFQAVLDYCQDEQEKRPIHARVCIGAAMRDDSGALANELYTQLVRQLNPKAGAIRPEHIDDAQAMVRGWELLALATGCVEARISELMTIVEENILQTYLDANPAVVNKNIRALAEVAVLRRKEFRETPAINKRQNPPCNAEFLAVTTTMTHTKISKCVLVKISTVDGATKTIQIAPTTTVSVANAMLCEKFNLKPEMGFALCGVHKHARGNDASFSPLPPKQRVCDSLAAWDGSSEGHSKELVFRRVISWMTPQEEIDSVHNLAKEETPEALTGLQAVAHCVMWDIANQRISCSETELQYLVALMLTSAGAAADEDIVTAERVLSMIPKGYKKKFKKKDFGKRFCFEVIDLMKSPPSQDGCKGMTQGECLAEIVDNAMSDGAQSGAGCFVFTGLTLASVKNAAATTKSVQKSEAWLVLNHQGISICQPGAVRAGEVDVKNGCVFWCQWSSLGTDNGTISSGEEHFFGGDGGMGTTKNAQFYFSCGSIQRPEKYVFSGGNTRFVQWLFMKLKDGSEGVGQGDTRGRTGGARNLQQQFKTLMT